jgi:hypothetical protein
MIFIQIIYSKTGLKIIRSESMKAGLEINKLHLICLKSKNKNSKNRKKI